MDKAQVIKLRDELKCGKNLPVRVLINNSFTIIDESHHLQFTKWDDTNGILYSLRLINVRFLLIKKMLYLYLPYHMIQLRP